MNIPRSEYPRPQFVRNEWINLNGEWEFEIDNGRSGRERNLQTKEHLDSKITVPFCPESKLSGLAHTDFMEAVWYKKTVTLPEGWQGDGRRTILHIGACDYETEVFVNGTSVGRHIGGFISFEFDITSALKEGANDIVITATDLLRRNAQPGGKQSKRFGSFGCFYTRTTGIWQTVWLENVPDAYIKKTKCTPSLANKCLYIDANCINAHGKTVTATAYYNGKKVGCGTGVVVQAHALLTVELSELHLWDVFAPELYDLTLEMGDDKVESYFGMREVAVNDEKIYINGRPVFQRLILDQGFYPDGIFTAPSDSELIADIQRSIDMGYNGARLHQKIFEERFLYHADKMGYLVWGETGNWGLDVAAPTAWQGFFPEWIEAVERDYNHPSIVVWCPLNETQQNQNKWFVKHCVDLTHALDSTRPVIDSSGWYHEWNLSDIADIHDYDQNPETFKAHYDGLNESKTAAIESRHPREVPRPVFVSEYGGIWWNPEQAKTVDTDKTKSWGYGNRVTSEEEWLYRYKGLADALLDNPSICALCYTQLTDVEQEQNGLYTYDRKPKFDPAVLAPIMRRKAAIEEE